MVVKKHLQKRVYVTAFSLVLLGHGETNNLASINFVELKRVPVRAKNLGDVGSEEELKVVGDGFLDAAHLFGGLLRISVLKMVHQLLRALRGIIRREVFESIGHGVFVQKEAVDVFQGHIHSGTGEHLQAERDVGLGVAFEKRLLCSLAQARHRVHD